MNPGEQLVLSDRSLTGVKPPAFDNPVSTGFRDDRTGIFFSSDSFGALLPEVPERADEIDPAMLREGQVRWATIDSPWLHDIDTATYARTLDGIRRLEPTMVSRRCWPRQWPERRAEVSAMATCVATGATRPPHRSHQHQPYWLRTAGTAHPI